MSTQLKHFGSGIVLFENAVSIDTSFVKSYIDVLRQIGNETQYVNEQGVLKNTGGYEFEENAIKWSPERFIETLPNHELIGDEAKQLISELEGALYSAAVEYCRVFPVALEAITWRIKGHIATYKNGQLIGCHSDVSVPGPIGQPAQNQNSLHNTLTAAVLLTDDYDGGELAFRMWDVAIKPPAGSIVMYPSTFVGAHEVLPVTSGERVSYLQWFCHGYLPAGMPPLTAEENLQAQYRWLPKLKEDVGQDYMYQRKVV